MPIDFFLRSLAEDQNGKAICIILSGTGTDGSMGLRAVHGAGGMTMVQKAETAKYEGMPQSALDTGLADFVLPVEKMPEPLLSYAKKVSAKKAIPFSITEREPSSLEKILMILRSETGHDFSYYKKNTIYRRIEKRMDLHNLENLAQYSHYLQQNSDEVQALFKELLIGVTSFFRDPEAYDTLKKKFLPLLLGDKPDGYQVRVWVPGCASGEETYSLAIVFLEYIEGEKRDLKLQIFGTDIDEEAIRRARMGLYLDNIAMDISPDRIRRFFAKTEGGIRLKKEVRETVIFAVQNVIKDAPFTKLDLISCRNLLIYLEPELQNRLLPLFHYSLKPGGMLLLGSSESIGKYTDLYSVLDKKWKIFQSKGAAPTQAAVLTTPWNYETVIKEGDVEIKKVRKSSVAEITQRLLLETFVPPSVIVNEKGDILYIHGKTGKYLEPAPGQPDMNVLEMAREGLRIELRSALHGAVSKKKEMRYNRLKVRTNGESATTDLVVKPLTWPDMEGLYLAVFEESTAAARPEAPKAKEKSGKKVDSKVQDLEQELLYTKESLQATIEELQAANEELRSTNEEFQSTNEELQSTNEELETSKEELQSVNEELNTVNSELQAKIDQQFRIENAMKSLLDSINVGTIFLDTDLKIKRFTSAVSKVFSLIPTDIGRPIEDIRSNLKYDAFSTDAQRTLETLQTIETELETRDGRWYLARIMPSRTPENVIDGIVATFTDVTPLRKAREELVQSRISLTGTLEKLCEGFLRLDGEGRVIQVSDGAEKPLRAKRDDLIGKPVWAVLPGLTSSQFKKALADKAPLAFETTCPGTDGKLRIQAVPSGGGLTVCLQGVKGSGRGE
jgi:two-component system CheB/CheR fusion protein